MSGRTRDQIFYYTPALILISAVAPIIVGHPGNKPAPVPRNQPVIRRVG
jgi:hypothetical protein